MEGSDNNCINDTESRIMRAAECEFMAKGFAGARTSSIAEAAGVTHAMLHYYFRTKEKLFEKIISEKSEMLIAVVAESLKDINLPLEDMIRNLINLHLDFISENPELPRFIISEIYSNPERLAIFGGMIRSVAPDVLSRLQRKIDDMADKGKCRRVDAKMLMLDIVSLNVFPYMASHIVNSILDNCMDDHEKFLELRKKENFETIMRKLKL